MSFDLLRSHEEAANALGRILAGRTDASPGNRFEFVRAMLWSLAPPGSKVHINRLLSAALPGWQVACGRTDISGEAGRSNLRDALSMLSDTGDLLELRRGYWAPATARFVELPEKSGCLLVGGVPTSMLPLEHDCIVYRGPYRYFATIPTDSMLRISVEDFTAWVKLPAISSLHDWRKHVLESAERSTYSPAELSGFEFYRPEQSNRAAPQFKRWTDGLDNLSGTHTLLARRTRAYGAREHRLVDVRDGQLVGAASLHDVDVRRLMYAFDLAAMNPVRARHFQDGGRSVWILASELPRAEQRMFAAFGTLTVPEERLFERHWEFARNEATAVSTLRSLGIELA